MEGQDYPEDPYQGAAQQWDQVEGLWGLELQWVSQWALEVKWDLEVQWVLADQWALEVKWVMGDQ